MAPRCFSWLRTGSGCPFSGRIVPRQDRQSTGCDAQPYFRIFNPVTQSQRFDPQGRFIRLYLPELAQVSDEFIHAPWTMSAEQQARAGVAIGRDYPAPIVDHAQARKVALELYAAARGRRD